MDFTLSKCQGSELFKENIYQKTADALPCKNTILSVLRIPYKGLNLDVNVEITEKIPEEARHFISTKR